MTRKRLLEFMKEHGYAYVSGIPTEDARADVDKVRLRLFYNDKLPDSVEGVHPSLVFNMDEMGAERYADRKRINVFLPEDEAPEDGGVPVGIPRSSRRCTLIACIALDGTRLTPAIVTKTETVNSLLFESGYDPERVKLYSTKKASSHAMCLASGSSTSSFHTSRRPENDSGGCWERSTRGRF